MYVIPWQCHGDGSHHGELLSYMAAITMAKGARIVMQVGLQRARAKQAHISDVAVVHIINCFFIVEAKLHRVSQIYS